MMAWKHKTFLTCSFLALPILVFAMEKGPKEMNLKTRFKVEGDRPAVIFQHAKHQEKLACDKCHESKEGGGKLNVTIDKKTTVDNDFHKKFCWPCHVEMNVPKGKVCSTCHKQ